MIKVLSLKIAIALAICFSLGACKSGQADSPYLTFNISPKIVQLLPTAASTCTDRYTFQNTTTNTGVGLSASATANSVVWSNVQYAWNRPGWTLYIGVLELVLNNADSGQTVISLDATEVDNLLGTVGGQITTSGITVATNNKATSGNKLVNCGLVAGGIKVNNNGGGGTLSGYVRVLGRAEDSSGNSEAVIKTIPISIQVLPIQYQ